VNAGNGLETMTGKTETLKLVVVPRKHAAIAWRTDSCEVWDEIARTWDEAQFEALTKRLLIDGMSERAAYLTDGRPCVVFPEIIITAVGYEPEGGAS